MNSWVNRCLDALQPRACVACGFDSGNANICVSCRADLPWLGPCCDRCALPLAKAGDPACGQCLAHPPPFDASHAPLRFSFPVNRLVHGFKFRRDSAMGQVLSEVLCSHMTTRASECKTALPDLWVPVPMHRWRLASRMLNPAFFLAQRLAARSGSPLAPHRLRRSRHTPTQTGLGASERKSNLRGAFCWTGQPLKSLHVGLVDDVMTTGSTVSECARVLKRNQAGYISIWIVARALNA
ncbi:MAG: ComF family protein [Xanthomonadales bacterium]|nr:ComF family protein [Xanthomonadales bacterium]